MKAIIIIIIICSSDYYDSTIMHELLKYFMQSYVITKFCSLYCLHRYLFNHLFANIMEKQYSLSNEYLFDNKGIFCYYTKLFYTLSL